MDDKQIQLFQAAIQVELTVSKIYQLFSTIFKQDQKFWLQLANEEKNHATLLRYGLEEYRNIDLFPQELLYSDIDQIIEFNKNLEKYLIEYSRNLPDQKTAYHFALQIEFSNKEKQYGIFMEKTPPESKLIRLFQMLNGENKDHIKRIKQIIEKYQYNTHSF